ncbi:bifunctional adenosylcobinamide kinase/adenosylcobinamide-phosphate guanylyltransferase [Actinomadura rudentiformis]|uniref:bifunctional adenosylcobinamide kinase/adenosylcobinamide-phosphate guanylyltransferase n=1 Tax=Actinomadura rudentiformis TaxID=359158 RepID=UPI001CEF64C5|nr:bifunctional adenosylcobinamide kinase/adenosylcobinamide-phosphate guanylyltransferase [Actinomadura rudentiformis]
MNIDLQGTAGRDGWPLPDCRCASCTRLRTAGISHEPTRILIDGVPLEKCSRWKVPGGYDVRSASGRRILVAGGPGERPEPVAETVYDAALLDLVGCPDHLGRLRHAGAVTAATEIIAVYVDHRIPSPEELERRKGFWMTQREGPHRTLLLGGSRSGKSAEAEMRLIGHPYVTYVATAVRGDDPEWAARIEAHQRRRPAWWKTVEATRDLAHLLASTSGAILVDGIGTWVAAVMSETGAWEEPARVTPCLDELITAWRATTARVVAVSDEVGLSLVPTTPAGRAFRDVLGDLNQRLAAESEEAALVVAGRVTDLL